MGGRRGSAYILVLIAAMIVTLAGLDLKLKAMRVRGTLVVELEPGARFKLDHPVCWEPHRPDYPALIVSGGPGSAVDIIAVGGAIDEWVEAENLNPAGMPYLAETDSVLDDSYPHEVRGVVHVVTPDTEVHLTGDLNIVGTIIAAGPVEISTPAGSLATDPALLANPPIGYSTGGDVSPMAGSWRWETQ